MAWLVLILAGICETIFATCLGKFRVTVGNAAALWFGAFLFFLLVSMVLLVYATRTIPIGTAYAVWTGIGAVGTVLVGIFVFSEPADFWRMFFISTLVISVIGLKVLSKS
jgi:quaternary ammonium compound-resistance protein SugE